MGLKDIVTYDYMSRKDVFADAFNFYYFNGDQVIDPAKLENLPAAETRITEGVRLVAQEKDRDILKRAVVMQDDKACYVILGMENQSYINYAMPARMFIYDALNYDSQLRKIAAKHKEERTHSGRSRDEWLSGFYSDDYLEPVLSLVVYFGNERNWGAPRTLHEMMRIPARFKKIIPDYRLNLLTPALAGEENFSKFRTDLNVVLGFLRYLRDKKKLAGFLDRHRDDFKHLAISAGRVLKACAKMDLLPLDETKEEIDMCEAIQEMIDEKIAEIRSEFAAEKAQWEQDKAQREQAYAAEKAVSIKKLKRLHTLSDEAIAEILSVPVNVVKSIDA